MGIRYQMQYEYVNELEGPIKFNNDLMKIVRLTSMKHMDVLKFWRIEVNICSKWKEELMRARKWKYMQQISS